MVQAHEAPPLHYDLMIEWGEALATWGLAQPPERVTGPQSAELKAEHRREYLEFEGEISGGRGRCAIWDRGTLRAWAAPGGALIVRMAGERCTGHFRLEPTEGGWMWTPTDAVPDGAIPAVDVPPAPAPAGEPAAAPGGGVRRRGARPPRGKVPVIVTLLKLAAVCVFLLGLGYVWASSVYTDRYEHQPYMEILNTYRHLLRDKNALRAVETEKRLEQRLVGAPCVVIGRIGGFETASSGTTHPAGEPLFVWIDVPNGVESANSTPLDVRCTVAHAQVDQPATASGGAHAHRFRRGDLVVVEGVLERYGEVDLGAWHTVLSVKDATIRAPGRLEMHFYDELARSLGDLPPMKGLTDPLREERPENQPSGR